MQIILKEDVPHLGKSGEIVTVKNGYGRNYLLPQGLAILATDGNAREVEHHKRVISAQRAKLLQEAQALAKKLQQVQLTLARQVGIEDRLFGSIGTRDIEQALQVIGLRVDRKALELSQSIRTLGEYRVAFKLAPDVEGSFALKVVAK